MKREPRVRRARKNTPLLFLLLLLIPLHGGYHAFSFLLAGGALALILVYESLRTKTLRIPTGPADWCLYGICVCTFLAIPFSVSSGMALTGGLRTLTWVLFALAASYYTPEERRGILDTVAYEGALLSLYSTVEFLYERFLGTGALNNRSSGFFQYANTWALFQLVCLLLLFFREDRRKLDWAAIWVLLLGIFFSGSRGTLILLFLWGLALGIRQLVLRRNVRSLLACAAAAALALGLTVFLSGGMVAERLNAITLSSSTLNGRLLYVLDGLRMLRGHPMGIGRGGTLYLQAVEQTGIYTVHYLHNEYLQAALEGGILCGLLTLGLAAALVLGRGRGRGWRERAVALTICLHALIDFDWQFNAVMFLLLLCGAGERSREIRLPSKGAVVLTGTAAALVFGYFSVVYYLDYAQKPVEAYRMFPADLSLAENYLQTFDSAEEAEALADRILSTTELSMVAWDCKYIAAAARDDLSKMAEYKYRYLRLNRYAPQVYRDLTDLLERGCLEGSSAERSTYLQLASREIEQLEEVRRSTSPLAYRVVDRVDLSFAEEVLGRLENILRNT